MGGRYWCHSSGFVDLGAVCVAGQAAHPQDHQEARQDHTIQGECVVARQAWERRVLEWTIRVIIESVLSLLPLLFIAHYFDLSFSACLLCRSELVIGISDAYNEARKWQNKVVVSSFFPIPLLYIPSPLPLPLPPSFYGCAHSCSLTFLTGR